MADLQYFTFQPQHLGEPEVKVFEYIVPNSSVRPAHIAYPHGRPPVPMMPVRTPSPAELLFHRWLYRRYGIR
jgi:hypothetical protein